ncbi:M23 family metallopeptidase [Candidatus Woesebacteria bacterium]|nr:M23 family metallopeptidase [Candidatus Woesebacteria bacterium]
MRRYIFFTILLFFFIPLKNVHAGITPRVVKITDGFSMVPGDIGIWRNGRTYYEINRIYVDGHYFGGKAIISSTPDGTGTIHAEDLLSFALGVPFRKGPYDVITTTTCGHAIEMPPIDVTHMMAISDEYSFDVYFYSLCHTDQERTVGSLYLTIFEPEQEPMFFLDLPWDYEAKGLKFLEASTAISSYFDHEYPLLSNTALANQYDVKDSLITYENIRSDKLYYTAHDGYDYAAISKAFLGDPVLAAAPGWATYVNSCGACGNAIYIDHDNGYQTRYYHLQPDGLVVSTPGEPVWVEDRQQIGKVGATGNVTGAHIHFMVVQDKNGDGNFSDNIPDGITDPYGWQSDDLDPWETFTFMQNGQEKTGNASYRLWKSGAADPPSFTLSKGGGKYLSGRYTFTFPKNSTDKDLVLQTKFLPQTFQNEQRRSVGFSIEAIAIDAFHTVYENFRKYFTIHLDASRFGVSRFKPDSLSIYSSSDGGETWQQEDTEFNENKDNAEISVNHLTIFSLMGEPLDSIAPVTTATMSGTLREDLSEYYDTPYVYETPVIVWMNPTDEPAADSLGVAYSMYKVVQEGEEDAEWQEYDEPFALSEEGTYTISFFSEDGDGNIEDPQSLTLVLNNGPVPTSTPTSTPTPTMSPTVSGTISPTSIPSQSPSPTVEPSASSNTGGGENPTGDKIKALIGTILGAATSKATDIIEHGSEIAQNVIENGVKETEAIAIAHTPTGQSPEDAGVDEEPFEQGVVLGVSCQNNTFLGNIFFFIACVDVALFFAKQYMMKEVWYVTVIGLTSCAVFFVTQSACRVYLWSALLLILQFVYVFAMRKVFANG